MIRAREEVQERDDAITDAAAAPDLPFEHEDHWTYPAGVRPERDEEDWNGRSHLLISASPEVVGSFRTPTKRTRILGTATWRKLPTRTKCSPLRASRKAKAGVL
jgi:hypothetical protein